MESERGIIIVGHCRDGKAERVAIMRQLLKEKLMLCSVGLNHISSVTLGLSSSFENAYIAAKKLNDAMVELREITPDKITSFNEYHANEIIRLSMTLTSFQEIENTIIYEKQPSKFISKPVHNFKKR